MYLHEKMVDSVEVNDKIYYVDFSFDSILTIYELFKDDDFNTLEKVDIAYDRLVIKPKKVSVEVKNQVINAIFEHLKPENSLSGKEPTFCFVQDAEYIYASFYKDYHIDLIDQQGKLHFEKFIALFNGLSDETIIKKIINIRTKPIPAPDKHNAKQIQEMHRLKHIYRLKKESTKEDEQKALKKLANSLIAFSESR